MKEKIINHAILILALLISGYFIFKTNGSKDGSLMLDSFGGELGLSTVACGASSDSSILVEPDTKIKSCGKQSMKVIYNLSKTGNVHCAKGYGLEVPKSRWEISFETVDWLGYGAFSIQFYGNNSGEVAFDLLDNGGEIYRFMILDNFKGWKEIIIPFSALKPLSDFHQQKAHGNNQIDLPIKAFQLEPMTSGKGSFNVDCVKLVKL